MSFLRHLAIDNDGVRKRFKLAAAIASGKNIISIGLNEMRTHPLQGKFRKNDDSIFLHAEIAAIANALNHVDREELKNATLYIHRVKRRSATSKEWVDGIALPCEGCRSAIAAFKIRRVIYSTDVNSEFEEVSYA